MGNSSGETQALVQTARHFLQADESLQSTHCPNFREHLICAENSFEQAIKVPLLFICKLKILTSMHVWTLYPYIIICFT